MRRKAPKHEVEVKLETVDADLERRRLVALGATLTTARTLEDNRLYDDRKGSLRKRGRLLRVRTAGQRHTLTFKKKPGAKRRSERYKVRVEHETSIADPLAMDLILRDLGYRPSWRYQKYRETYALHGVTVEIDETPIGGFLELEGDPEAIDRVASLLGRSAADYILKNYRRLHEERAGTRTPADLVFVR